MVDVGRVDGLVRQWTVLVTNSFLLLLVRHLLILAMHLLLLARIPLNV